MTYYIGLDPGRQGFGWGVCEQPTLSAPWRLIAAGVTPQPKPAHFGARVPLTNVAVEAAASIFAAVPGLHFFSNANRAVVERMVHYPRKPSAREKARTPQADVKIANDLLDLQALGGMVAAALVPLQRVVWRSAHEWKRGLDWEAIEKRLHGCAQLAIAPVLDPAEKKILDAVRPDGLRHNAVEASAMVLQEVERVRWY